MVRIVIADDHGVVRDGLTALLEEEPGWTVVGTAADGQEALELIRRLRPDLALLDITMPGMSGLEVARIAARELPQVRILILTMHEEEAFFFEALRAGAAGYVLKGAGSEELLSALHAVLEGGVYLPPKLAALLVQDYLEGPREGGTDPLTPREREIVRLIAQGLTNRQIAERLVLSLNTVKTHRLNIYRKLGLQSRSELVAYALRRGWLRPEDVRDEDHP